MALTQDQAAAVLLARRQARRSLESFAQYVEIPGQPVSDEADAGFKPVETKLALHHRVICRAIQRALDRPYGRLLVMAPPGSAKSSYVSVAAPAWIMGAKPGVRVIGVGHKLDLAAKASRRAREIARSDRYRKIFGTELPNDQRAVDEWALTNGSTFMAAGIISGITGNRAEVMLCDDLIPTREAAESDTMRDKIWGEWRDGARTRLVPGGTAIHVQTRWHEDDVAGRLLPVGWKGESGVFKGTDGLDWEVLCLPARVEPGVMEDTDPLGRRAGEYLWPEWFKHEDWVQVDPALGAPVPNTATGRRSWSSMFQQQPKPDDGILFRRPDLMRYPVGTQPAGLRMYGASDWAVTDAALSEDPDYTEHGVGGVDTEGNLWLTDWWYKQGATDVTIAAWLEMVRRWKPVAWFGERGVIESAIGPTLDRALRDASPRLSVDRVLLPTAGAGNKVARIAGIKIRVELRKVYIPECAWGDRLVEQLLGFPGLKHDDAPDVMGLFGRGLADMWNGVTVRPVEREAPLPGPLTYEWWERVSAQERAEAAERAAYLD